MKRIGITGPTGAGKTTALRALEKLGVCILDADAIYYQLLENDQELNRRLRERYGDGILDERGKIDRKKLGAIVFSDPAALSDLNEIIRLFVRREIDRLEQQAREQGVKAVAVDAIRLIEGGMGKTCDVVVSVVAPVEVRVKRIMTRDNISEEYARSRIAVQPPEEFYRKHSHYVFNNDGSQTPEEFEQTAIQYFQTVI